MQRVFECESAAKNIPLHLEGFRLQMVLFLRFASLSGYLPLRL
jgi:hypothetical protein